MAAFSRYKAALAAVFLAAPGLAFPEAVKAAGALLPEGAEKVAENRYRIPKSWDETIRFYRQTYGAKFARRPIADRSGVKAVHIENPEAKPGSWEGLNVYEAKNEIRVFVLVKGR